MDNIRNIYRRITLVMVATLFITICSTYIYFITNIGKVYEQHAVESILDVKKEFIKSIIDNLILEIEIIQTQEKEHYKQWVSNNLQILQDYYEVSPENYMDLFINFCETNGNKEIASVSIKDTKSNEIIYESGIFKESNYGEQDLSSYFKETYDDYEIFFGVSNQFIDNNIKRLISDRIRSREFSKGSNIWVNEIRNYFGGTNYAVRVINPNSPDEEGQYLSTDILDIEGHYPYQEELQGLKENGEIFFNNHFKKKDSNLISEKISYAKLYKKYNWVIATDVHLDDIESYIKVSTADTDTIVTKIIKNTILFMLLIFISYGLLISKIEKWYYGKYSKRLKEVFIDPLTKADNRRAATINMESAFKKFKKTGHSPMIMMIDIDDFKKVNDTFGHLEGDMVLKNVVNLINNHIRGTDTLYRWGGEEFLLICDGLKEKDVIPFSNKIIAIVGSEEYESNGEKYHATISVGVGRFEPLDKTYEDGIKRADAAMYSAKEQGKNRACLGNICGNNPLEKDE